jgi:hypothetical protein
MFFGAQFMYLMRLFRMEQKYLNGTLRECLGLFLGFSDLHSSHVPLVMNMDTGKISPLFHVTFDDTFQTVNSLPLNQPLDKQWAQIF